MDDVFIGRRLELAQLESLVAEVKANHPRLVLVEGPAGIGKTALVERFLTTLAAGQVLRAGGDEDERNLAYGVVGQLLRRLTAGSNNLVDLEWALPIPDPLLVGARLLDILGNLQDDAPVVLIVEDLHWGDAPSMKAIAFALRRLQVDRVLAVMTVRDDAKSALPPGLVRLLDSGGTHVLRLMGLVAPELAELATALGAGTLPATAAQRLVDHTGGNPLHLRALLDELAPEVLCDEADLPAPRSFATLVLKRLASCAPVTERLVVACAVLGMRVPLAQAARLAAAEDPLAGVEEAVASGLLVALTAVPVQEIAFVHPLVRAAVYHDLGAARRAQLHLAAAELVDDEAATLRHQVAGAAGEDAELATRVAGFARRQARSGAWATAVTGLRSAARLTSNRERRERLLLEATDCLMLSGDLNDIRDARSLADEVASFGDSAWRNYVRGRLALTSGRHAEAESLFIAAWKTARTGLDPELTARSAAQVAFLCTDEVRSEDAVRWARRALEAAPAGTAATAHVLATLVVNLFAAGRAEEGLALVASLPNEPVEPTPEEVDGLLGRAMVRMWTDDQAGARSDFVAVVAACRLRGPFYTRAIALRYLGQSEYRSGHWDDARVHGELAVSDIEDANLVWMHAFCHAEASFIPSAQGDFESAQAHCRAAVNAARMLDNVAATTWAAMGEARLGQARGRLDLVANALEPVANLATQHPAIDEPGIQPWRELWAEALVSLGRLDEAESALERAEALAIQRRRRSSLVSTARARAVLEAARGCPAEADAAFGRGLVHAEGLAQPFETALLRDAYGRFLRRTGRRRMAADQLSCARMAFERLHARPFLDRCDAELAACGLKPQSRGHRGSLRLTAQELAVAQMVASGLTNREVASELVLSVKTIEYHLGHVFTKLGVAHRSQVHAALATHHRGQPKD